jgi:type IV secretory pathway component VirB8
VLVVLQTDTDEEPVEEDAITFDTTEWVEASTLDSDGQNYNWVWWVIGTLSILLFLALIAILFLMYYCHKQKQQKPTYSPQRQQTHREKPQLRQDREQMKAKQRADAQRAFQKP